MARRILFALIAGLIATAAHACSLCGVTISKATLAEEMDLAPVVVYGTLSNPQVGAGTVDLHVETVLKDDNQLGATRDLTLDRYVPVPDPKQPPRYLVFLEKSRGKFFPTTGFATKSPAVLEYLDGAKSLRKQSRVAVLAYYAKFFGHADTLISTDAFLEFAKSTDADVGAAGRSLDPTYLRSLLAGRDLDPDRMSMFAFLLGCCGEARDYAFLLELSAGLDNEHKRALDGIFAGCISLRPQEGWQNIRTILADDRKPLQTRLAAWRAIRFLHGWKNDEHRPEIARALDLVVRDAELADLGVEDLRRWKEWGLTKTVLEQFDRHSHQAPIIRRSIIRYALSCPSPEARRLVARARQLDREYVEDQEELLRELEPVKLPRK